MTDKQKTAIDSINRTRETYVKLVALCIDLAKAGDSDVLALLENKNEISDETWSNLNKAYTMLRIYAEKSIETLTDTAKRYDIL